MTAICKAVGVLGMLGMLAWLLAGKCEAGDRGVRAFVVPAASQQTTIIRSRGLLGTALFGQRTVVQSASVFRPQSQAVFFRPQSQAVFFRPQAQAVFFRPQAQAGILADGCAAAFVLR